MLLSGPDIDQVAQWGGHHARISSVERLRPPPEIGLINEPLRTLRLIHHAAWVSRRWREPAFQRAFAFIGSEKFWSEHILELREQLGELSAGNSQLADQLRSVSFRQRP